MTEDPAHEFILLRDLVLFEKILKNDIFAVKIKELKDLLHKNKTGNKDLDMNINKEEYQKISLSKFEEKEISKKMKLERVIINRLFSIFKYILTVKSQENKIIFKEENKIIFKEEIKNKLKNTDGATFNIKKFMRNRKPYSPYIYFYEEEYIFDIEEYKNIFSANQQSKFN